MSGLDCKKCDGKLRLIHDDKVMTLKKKKKVGIANTPLLMCSRCEIKYIPYMTKDIITGFMKILGEDELEKNVDKSVEIVEKDEYEDDYQQDEVSVWYDFNKIKMEVCNDKYIAEKVKFIYDKDDYYFIPGLTRPWKIGFLTPVFFNIEVLLKYLHHPSFGLDIGADTFGYIYKGDEHYISFGINENNKVLMWLGDIIELDINEQFYLRSENIPSDHSIGSEFYEAQIEVKWAEASAEKKLLKERLEFNEKVRNNFSISIVQLDTETLRVAKNICKLLINTNEAFKDLMIPLNELFVEAINNKEIIKYLKQKYPEVKEEIKGKKGIKLLQYWLEKNTDKIDINTEIAPLFVLYDLRLVSAHLYPDESREEMLSSCCTRLDLSETERNYITISNRLIEKLFEMYKKFNESLCIHNNIGEDETIDEKGHVCNSSN
ncbi:hypothetical protein [[Clostridium] fimetarium]|uniref:Uncharacterized protein n=1 Tax=[Clostridium] fimetarium TaxID=99656 RepID=A0A1I0R016_9FIRM|nr:hypothetical protein [[Clostridium] fimetarium]SEW33380.1 hypothetical protein SAMN05421659_110103 [[Clostridium] fimetarium]